MYRMDGTIDLDVDLSLWEDAEKISILKVATPFCLILPYLILSRISRAINCHLTLISQMVLSLYPLPINYFFYFMYSIILSHHVQGASPGSPERLQEGKIRPQRGHRQSEDNA